MRSGYTYERTIFEDDSSQDKTDVVIKQFGLKDFNKQILRKATSKLEFYKFDNLQMYFPSLKTMNEFIDSLTQIKVDLRSSKERLGCLMPDDNLEICIKILSQLQSQIKSGYTEYKGTTLFVQSQIKDIVKNKTLQINVDDLSDQEFGVAMSDAKNNNLRLNILNKDWYIYDENYGTSEEKHFIQFINGMMEKLEEEYTEIFLVRNEKLFQLYRFSDGQPLEPDFVLFMKKIESDKHVQYQLFIEPKGSHLLQADKWKEDFLKEIEDKCETQVLAEDTKYKLIGMPFYNEGKKSDFIEAFKNKMGIE